MKHTEIFFSSPPLILYLQFSLKVFTFFFPIFFFLCKSPVNECVNEFCVWLACVCHRRRPQKKNSKSEHISTSKVTWIECILISVKFLKNKNISGKILFSFNKIFDELINVIDEPERDESVFFFFWKLSKISSKKKIKKNYTKKNRKLIYRQRKFPC